jgi:hypothetical protein
MKLAKYRFKVSSPTLSRSMTVDELYVLFCETHMRWDGVVPEVEVQSFSQVGEIGGKVEYCLTVKLL